MNTDIYSVDRYVARCSDITSTVLGQETWFPCQYSYLSGFVFVFLSCLINRPCTSL